MKLELDDIQLDRLSERGRDKLITLVAEVEDGDVAYRARGDEAPTRLVDAGVQVEVRGLSRRLGAPNGSRSRASGCHPIGEFVLRESSALE